MNQLYLCLNVMANLLLAMIVLMFYFSMTFMYYLFAYDNCPYYSQTCLTIITLQFINHHHPQTGRYRCFGDDYCCYCDESYCFNNSFDVIEIEIDSSHDYLQDYFKFNLSNTNAVIESLPLHLNQS